MLPSNTHHNSYRGQYALQQNIFRNYFEVFVHVYMGFKIVHKVNLLWSLKVHECLEYSGSFIVNLSEKGIYS